MLKSKMILKLLKPFVMVQYAPPRTGSTLIFNLMREVFPHKKILKVHSFRKVCYVLSVVATIRHPYDAFASSLLRHGVEKASDDDVRNQIKIFNESGLHELPNIEQMENVLLLRYEKFVNDYDYVFNEFEKFFTIKISTKKREALKDKFGIKNVEKMIKGMDTFTDLDKKSQLHGKHISKFKGGSNYYNKVFSEEQIKIFDKEYGALLKTLGY